MKNNDNDLINENYEIKVNKKQKQSSQNKELSYDLNDINILNDEIPTSNFVKKIILSKIRDKKRQKYISQRSDNYNDIYNGNPLSLSCNYKHLNYRKINNKIYKNENRQNNYRPRYTANITQKRTIEDENGNNGSKLLIYKSETHYPLSYRKNKYGYDSLNNINNNNNIYKKDINLRNSSISPKFKANKNKHSFNNNNYNDNYNDNYNENNILYNYENNAYRIKKKYNNYPMEAFSYMTFNNFGDFYQPIKEQINNNTNYYYNNNENIYLNDMDYPYEEKEENNYVEFSKNVPYLSKTVNRRNGYKNDEYIEIFRRNNLSNFKKSKNKNNDNYFTDNEREKSKDKNKDKDKDKDKELINVYKGKLIKIFVQFMNNFYKNYKKKLFGKFISELKKIKDLNINKNKNKLMNKSNKNNQIKKKNNKNSFKNKYIQKSKISNKSNNNLNNEENPIKALSSNKKISKVSLYKKINRKRKINEKTNRYHNESEEAIKKSSSNVYVPAKSRITFNNYNNAGSKTKLSIFNEIKIVKNCKLLELEFNNKDLNQKIKNFSNTNYKNFYDKKIHSYKNSINNIYKEIEKKKDNNILPQNKDKKVINKNIRNIKENRDNNNFKKQNTFYKKIANKENEMIDNNINNNINIYMKKNKKLNRYSTSYKLNNNYNSIIFIKKNKDNNNINNYNINNNIINNINKNINNFDNNNINNSVNLSNDTNNYCLNDKPLNILFVKNNNIENEDEISNSNNEKDKIITNLDEQQNIENSLIITEDKRLFINFNYISLNNFYNKKNEYNFYYNLIISKCNWLCILVDNNENNNIQNGIQKMHNLISNRIYIIKYIFFIYLKQINSLFLFRNIIDNIFKYRLKIYFILFKKNIKIINRKKNNHVIFKDIIPIPIPIKKEITIKNVNKNSIKNKKNNFNYIINSNKNSENNFINPKKINKLQGKEKLKFLIKQMNKNNNNNNFGDNIFYENNNELNFEDNNICFGEDKIEEADNQIPIPLWKSNDLKKYNISIMNKQKNIYLKKNIKQKNVDNNI